MPAPIPARFACGPQAWQRTPRTVAFPGAHETPEIPTQAAEAAEDRAALNPVQAQRDHLTDPDDVYVSERDRAKRWSAFEEQLRKNRVDVTASCRSCGTARDRVA